MTDALTTMWIPSCRAHAPQFSHWATTQMVALGQSRSVSPKSARKLPKRFKSERLMAPVDAEPLSPGVESRAPQSGLKEDHRIFFTDGRRLFKRLVGPALPLPVDSDEGKSAEIAVFDAAATWGMPDFAYTPLLHHRGSGIREVGDAVLVLHDLGLVVQVKRRECPSDDPAKEVRWIRKVGAKALKQSNGSLRTLRDQSLKLENARDEILEVQPDDRRWLGVILIDHPDLPSDSPPLGDARTLALTRRDWEFLFAHLKSTYAVARYVEIALELESVPLGDEPVRYHQLAAAAEQPVDDGPERNELRRHFTEGKGIPLSIFPQMPVGDPSRRRVQALHSFFTSLQHDLAMNDEDDVELRHEMLSRLDSLPPGVKEYFSQTVLEGLRKASRRHRRGGVTAWGRLRVSDRYPQMVYIVTADRIENYLSVLAAFQIYEHYKFARVDGFPDSATTIGLVITPQNDGLRPWEAAFTFVKGKPEVSDSDLAGFKENFGPFWDDDDKTGLTGTTVPTARD